MLWEEVSLFQEKNWVNLKPPEGLKGCTIIANIERMVAIVIYPDGRKYKLYLAKLFSSLPEIPKERE